MTTTQATSNSDNPEHPNYVGRIAWRVHAMMTKADRIAAIKAVRTWLRDTGRGDSYTRAVNFVEDVVALQPWVVRAMDRSRLVRFHRLAKTARAGQAEGATLTLRKNGYTSWLESDGIWTNATRTEVALAAGTSTILAR